MSEYYWDSAIEYLRNTRGLYYNDDYLEFLVKNVWKMNTPINIVDYGCGYGYLGLKLLPLLPKGSTYTGIDKGKDLIMEAREVFDKSASILLNSFKEILRICLWNVSMTLRSAMHFITYGKPSGDSSENDG